MTAMQNHTRDNSRRTALLYARLIDPGTGLDETGGLLVEDGRIVDLGPDVAADTVGDAHIIDCGGHVLAPGLIDMLAFSSSWAGQLTLKPPLPLAWGLSPSHRWRAYRSRSWGVCRIMADPAWRTSAWRRWSGSKPPCRASNNP